MLRLASLGLGSILLGGLNAGARRASCGVFRLREAIARCSERHSGYLVPAVRTVD
jgi:hypothetical protein